MVDLGEWVARRRSEAGQVAALDTRGVTPSLRDLGSAIRTGRGDLVGIPVLSPPDERAARELAGRAAAADVAAVAFAGGPLGGSLAAARAASDLLPATPVLRLDPVVSEGQVLEARLAGADAVLLPVGFLDDGELRRLSGAARATLMAPVYLVRTPAEWEAARAAEARFLLVASLDFSLASALDLARRLPRQASVCLWADGLDGPQSLRELAGAADGALLSPAFPAESWAGVAVVEPVG